MATYAKQGEEVIAVPSLNDLQISSLNNMRAQAINVLGVLTAGLGCANGHYKENGAVSTFQSAWNTFFSDPAIRAALRAFWGTDAEMHPRVAAVFNNALKVDGKFGPTSMAALIIALVVPGQFIEIFHYGDVLPLFLADSTRPACELAKQSNAAFGKALRDWLSLRVVTSKKAPRKPPQKCPSGQELNAAGKCVPVKKAKPPPDKKEKPPDETIVIDTPTEIVAAPPEKTNWLMYLGIGGGLAALGGLGWWLFGKKARG